ncbi:uncharacterized protein BCR38DRAFT_448479 [Pseudomassariella vexata]|uniref:Uncharacterized protein n=1 Tax=Pseudomassariella vexata TaxID=1141098 RepID=A0A1Y2DG36_9PEZI|nr:uncharacterized protein BCR38DRAFT_448479 [Pseudomassariella vexata]ORY58252.1 hypothetical protein BCR38DRAFT_448479 [Pseudomassariella vexata]
MFRNVIDPALIYSPSRRALLAGIMLISFQYSHILMDDGNAKHTHFRAQCGICGLELFAGVSFVPLICCESVLCLDNAIFPENGNKDLTLDGNLLCWSPSCRRCGLSPEAVAIHSDCFKMFKKECTTKDALNRLWTAVVSRSPWRGAPNFQLDRDTNLAIDLVCEMAEKYGIPSLRLLPPELIRMIQDYSQSGTFWRYISVTSFSRELSVASVNPISILLCNISTWVRGREPTLLESPGHPSIIRLTMDSRGIREIERLSHRPPYQHWRSDNMAFAIQEESHLGNITTQYKVVPLSKTMVPRSNAVQYSVLRLELPENFRGFHIWDMPNPPRLEDCRFCGHIPQSTRFRTIDLRGATGLTFFFSFSKVYAIHAHTPKMPHAKREFERLTKRRQADMAWVYLPIPKGDDITALGVRVRHSEGRFITQKPCFLVRTKLAGDVSIGPCRRGKYKDIILSQLNPSLFIYNTADLGPATIFGTYSLEQRNDISFLPFHHRSSDDASIHHANFSSAPLNNVTRIQVFEDEELGFCRAMLFDYENGARRAVGNCRLGVDPAKTYLNPSRICYCSTQYLSQHSSVVRQMIRVESGSESTHRHQIHTWVCSAMEGNLEFWFSGEESIITIVLETEDKSD